MTPRLALYVAIATVAAIPADLFFEAKRSDFVSRPLIS
jgi:hypothetical protein